MVSRETHCRKVSDEGEDTRKQGTRDLAICYGKLRAQLPLVRDITEPDVIVLDEALDGFVRLFERSYREGEAKQCVIECLKRLREELAEMKLALTNCKRHDESIDRITEHVGRTSYCMRIQGGPLQGCQPVFQHCTTLSPGMLEWVQANVEWEA